MRELGPTPGCPRASARRASRRDQAERQARRRAARLRRRAARQRRALHRLRHRRRAGAAQPRALPSGRAARGARQLRLRQRRDRRGAGSTTPPRPRARRRSRVGRRPRRGGARLDRRRSATTCRSTRCCKGILAARARSSSSDGDAALPAGDPDDRRRSRSAPTSRSTLPSGTVRLSAQCKGAGMISPRFATMLCFVQTDAGSARRDRRPAARRVRQALLRPRLGGRPALDQRHRHPDVLGRRAACAVAPESEDELRFGEALDALLRQLAIMMVADGEGAGRIARVRRARRATPRQRRGRRARGRQLAAGQGRAARRRPQLGPHRAGRRRRALPGTDAAARRHLDRGHPGLLARAPRSPTTSAALARGGRSARRSSTRSRLPGEGAETEVFFSDLSHEYVTINADYTT